MKAAPHPQQDARLRTLRAYEILDTDREQEFDDIVQLASQLCGVPISVVNLIDAERQWFKAEVGLGVRETPLDTSLCAHAILDQDFVEIPDTLADARMAGNPLVYGDPGLRFYAGALLRAENGLPIGTLCVLGYEPRQLTPLQRDTLRVLARQVTTQLDLRAALRRADILRREVDHRVKNSLQSLAAIARLQGRHAATAEAKAAFSQMEGRIDTLSLLHEQLYRADSGAHVDLGVYLQNLAISLSAFAPPGVRILCDAASVSVGSKTAALIGTIVNESATNSFKHAFPDGRTGNVRFDLRMDQSGNAVLELADNGVGAQPAAMTQGKGLGIKVIAAISTQMAATTTFEPVPVGTLTRIVFPLF